jgi:hypothetical protein
MDLDHLIQSDEVQNLLPDLNGLYNTRGFEAWVSNPPDTISSEPDSVRKTIRGYAIEIDRHERLSDIWTTQYQNQLFTLGKFITELDTKCGQISRLAARSELNASSGAETVGERFTRHIQQLGCVEFEDLYYLLACKTRALYHDLQVRVASKTITLKTVLHNNGVSSYDQEHCNVRDFRNLLRAIWYHLLHPKMTGTIENAINHRKYQLLTASPLLPANFDDLSVTARDAFLERFKDASTLTGSAMPQMFERLDNISTLSVTSILDKIYRRQLSGPRVSLELDNSPSRSKLRMKSRAPFNSQDAGRHMRVTFLDRDEDDYIQNEIDRADSEPTQSRAESENDETMQGTIKFHYTDGTAKKYSYREPTVQTERHISRVGYIDSGSERSTNSTCLKEGSASRVENLDVRLKHWQSQYGQRQTNSAEQSQKKDSETLGPAPASQSIQQLSPVAQLQNFTIVPFQQRNNMPIEGEDLFFLPQTTYSPPLQVSATEADEGSPPLITLQYLHSDKSSRDEILCDPRVARHNETYLFEPELFDQQHSHLKQYEHCVAYSPSIYSAHPSAVPPPLRVSGKFSASNPLSSATNGSNDNAKAPVLEPSVFHELEKGCFDTKSQFRTRTPSVGQSPLIEQSPRKEALPWSGPSPHREPSPRREQVPKREIQASPRTAVHNRKWLPDPNTEPSEYSPRTVFKSNSPTSHAVGSYPYSLSNRRIPFLGESEYDDGYAGYLPPKTPPKSALQLRAAQSARDNMKKLEEENAQLKRQYSELADVVHNQNRAFVRENSKLQQTIVREHSKLQEQVQQLAQQVSPSHVSPTHEYSSTGGNILRRLSKLGSKSAKSSPKKSPSKSPSKSPFKSPSKSLSRWH